MSRDAGPVAGDWARASLRIARSLRSSGFRRAPADVMRFVRDFRRYRKLGGVADVNQLNPRFGEATDTHSVDHHYFLQAVWCANLISKDKPKVHHDVGSQALFVGMLTAITEVVFVDLRPLAVEIPSYTEKSGDILDLPFADRSIGSLSCLHVIEHIGLGRYGDRIDPQGSEKAARELVRVLAPGGSLYVSVPIGRPRTQFNAHRIFSFSNFRSLFADLELVEFSAVNGEGRLISHAARNSLQDEKYGLGLFSFRWPD